jgi:hypothetical protein
MKRVLLTAALLLMYVLHQDIWFWRTAHPLAFGFLPIGLAYHGLFTLLTSVLMWVLVKYAWPTRLEHDAEGTSPKDGASH